jgi:hypothetical protein
MAVPFSKKSKSLKKKAYKQKSRLKKIHVSLLKRRELIQKVYMNDNY